MEQKLVLLLLKRGSAYSPKSQDNPTYFDTDGFFDFSQEKELREGDLETFGSKEDAMYALIHDYYRYNCDDEEGNFGATYAIVPFPIAKAIFECKGFDFFDKAVASKAEDSWFDGKFFYSEDNTAYI